MSAFRSHVVVSAGAVLIAAGSFVFVEASPAVAATLTWQDISPDTDDGGRNAASGGRVNGLASTSGNNAVYYAASEFGGVFKTTNGGASWNHLDGHLPTVMWDVEVDPASNSTVYATSFYDGRVDSVSGIQRSSDAGATWSHPASATPPASGPAPFSSCPAARRSEPAAFGIGIHPTNSDVYIGTNCGVARSVDSGATWTFTDPTVGTAASDVWDVAVTDDGTTNGIVDVCGGDGVFRSTDGGANWNNITGTLPGPFGRCSITVSPDENYVLVVNFGRRIWQTNDTGANWVEFTPSTSATTGGRIPFVVTNQRTTGFDLWIGQGVQLARAACTTPAAPAPGGTDRCPQPASWTNEQAGAHDDTGDVVFDTGVATDRCPRVYSSDGGVFTNTVGGAGCHSPTWADANVGLHALWLYSLKHADQPGDDSEDLYMGLQDNGAAGSTNAGAANVTWHYPNCCDVFNIAAEPARVVWDTWSGYSQSWGNPGMSTVNGVATFFPGNATQGVDLFTFPDNIDNYGANQYVVVSASGAFTTNDITANPVVWTAIGTGGPAGGFCGVQAAVSGGTPTFYAQTGCLGVFESGSNRGPFQLWKLVGTGGTWDRVDDNFSATSGIEIFAVDPTDPDRLYASHLSGPEGARMIFSTDGGTSWTVDDDLTALMDGLDAFKMQTTRGATSFTGFNGYVQPSLVAFDPEDPDVIVAGGRDSGVFISDDGGQNWTTITDPFTSNTSGVPHLPRPFFAEFDHEPGPAGTTTVFIGTQGRGVWRVRLRLPTADAGGPYITPEGTDVTLDASASTDPDGETLSYAWDLDDDGAFDDAFVVDPTFDMVGQDGVFRVRVKVTSSGGATDVDDATVTVTNVAPSIPTLTTDGPQPENTAITIDGVASDPGWLDPLSGTIDWGDGTSEAVVGVLENSRPDATLTFGASHVYGDDGAFSVEVCIDDDDTTTCRTVIATITNVDPTTTIDETGTTLINGVPTFMASIGDPVEIPVNVTDPGSDDEEITWDWDDGTTDVQTFLRNPPDPDPDPSPSIQPVLIDTSAVHAWTDACFYEVVVTARDDDGGSGDDTANVIIVGDATATRSAGYWFQQYGLKGSNDFDLATLQCYLDITGFMSLVFHEVRDASTPPLAREVLNAKQTRGSDTGILDRQLLAAWSNFANGAVGWTEPVDITGDGVADTTFAAAVQAAELVRLNPASTKAQLVGAARQLELINVRDE